MQELLITLLFAVIVFPALWILLEKLWPSVPGYRILRRGFFSDVIWYGVQSLVSRSLSPLVVFAVLLPVPLALGMSTDSFFSGFGPVAQLPFAWQALLAFVLADFLLYWSHRFFHSRAAWPFHAVHHSPDQLDWLAATRMHPVNEVGAQIISACPVLLLGFQPMALVVWAPFFALHSVFIHCNVRVSFGPFRYVLASPIFHRWHHTTREAGLEKNFASYLPVWDLLFGTFYMPKGVQPAEFGLGGEVPDGFTRQFLYPLMPSSWRQSPAPVTHK